MVSVMVTFHYVSGFPASLPAAVAFRLPHCVDVTVEFFRSAVMVNEIEGTVEVCVRKNLDTSTALTLDLTFREGSANGNCINQSRH